MKENDDYLFLDYNLHPEGPRSIEEDLWLEEMYFLIHGVRRKEPPSRPVTLCNLLRCSPGPEHYLDFDNLTGAKKEAVKRTDEACIDSCGAYEGVGAPLAGGPVCIDEEE